MFIRLHNNDQHSVDLPFHSWIEKDVVGKLFRSLVAPSGKVKSNWFKAMQFCVGIDGKLKSIIFLGFKSLPLIRFPVLK